MVSGADMQVHVLAVQVVSGSTTLTATVIAFLCSTNDPFACLSNPTTRLPATNPIARCKVSVCI